MAEANGARPLHEIALILGAELIGDGKRPISRPVPAGQHDPEGLTFASSPKHLSLALSGPIGAILVSKGLGPQSFPTLEVANPRASFMMVLAMFDRTPAVASGIHPTAVISPGARVAPGASVGAFAVIEEGAVIGEGAQIGPQCWVGARSHIGEETLLYPGVKVYHDVEVGSRCILHAGCVIGADGFGFAFLHGRQVKIPQVGRVVLEDDVEIGANTCIDRATCGETRIGAGVKLDDLVMVGHNTKIGSHTVVASGTGISGSVIIGQRCTIAGQVGVGDHAVIADDVTLGGQSGATGHVEAGAYTGTPLMPIGQAMRVNALFKKLPELAARIKSLEAELKEIKGDR